MLRDLSDKVAPHHTAVLAVDLQNDFCAVGGYMHREGVSLRMVDQMVPPTRTLLAAARQAEIATIYFRANYSSVSNWYLSQTWLERASRVNREGGHLDYGVCEEGSWGFEFFGDLGPVGSSNELVITKHRYSGFVGTEVDIVLRSRGVRTVVIVGVASNVCVESTARDAFMRDYYVVLPRECCATYSDEEQRATLRNIDNYFGEVVPMPEVVGAWGWNHPEEGANGLPGYEGGGG